MAPTSASAARSPAPARTAASARPVTSRAGAAHMTSTTPYRAKPSRHASLPRRRSPSAPTPRSFEPAARLLYRLRGRLGDVLGSSNVPGRHGQAPARGRRASVSSAALDGQACDGPPDRRVRASGPRARRRPRAAALDRAHPLLGASGPGRSASRSACPTPEASAIGRRVRASCTYQRIRDRQG
jgi:hypothetical protein